MSIYRNFVESELKDGPTARQELIERLCPSKMSIRRLQKTFNEMLNDGVIFVNHTKNPATKKVIAFYGLKGHEYRLHEKLGSMQRAIDELRRILLRNPKPDELAYELRMTPKEAENLAYSTAKETGWRFPTEEEADISWEKMGETLFLAARLKRAPRLWSKRFAHEPQMLECARFYLTRYPEMLPRLNRDASSVVHWPETALRYLGKPYRPMRPVARTRVAE